MANELVNYKERLAARAKEVNETMQPAIVQLSLASGQMSIMEQPIPGNAFEAVILGIGTQRTYYPGAYDADNKSPPACYSQMVGYDDPFNPTGAPAENVPEPFAATCAECSFSKPGSADKGKGSACKSRVKLVTAPAGIVQKPEDLGKQLMIIDVPPTSGKNLIQYVRQLGNSGVPPEAAVTRIKYGPSKKYMFEMNFEPVGPIDNDAALGAIFAKMDEGAFEPLLTQGFNYEDASSEPEPEPTKKTSKKF